MTHLKLHSVWYVMCISSAINSVSRRSDLQREKTRGDTEVLECPIAEEMEGD